MNGSLSSTFDLKTRLDMFVAQINSKYQQLLGQYVGAKIPDNPPTCADPWKFWLDDRMPFIKHRLERAGLFQEYLLVPTGPHRSLWISAALDRLYEASRFLDDYGLAELVLMACFQNSFCYFFILMSDVLDDPKQLTESTHPIFLYHQAAKRKFGELPGGSEVVGGPHNRYSPIGFNFRDVLLGRPNRIDGIVESLFALCGKVNLSQGRNLGVDIEETRKIIHETSPCDMGHFRIQLFLYFCSHLRLRLHSGPHLRQMIYPVPGCASHNHLKKHGLHLDVPLSCDTLLREMTKDGNWVQIDTIETMLCESFDDRLLTMFDIFVRGQSLFLLDENGSPWFRPYGSQTLWSRVAVHFKVNSNR
jgi:hypothetical protein